MNPSVDVRITTMIRALADVIVPALDQSPGLASEQAQLVLGHLHVLREQLGYAAHFEQLEWQAATSLGEALVGATTGPRSASPAWRELEVALSANAGAHAQDTRDRAEAIRAGVEELIRTDTAEAARLGSIILEHERAAANLNRSWFAGMGWESGDSGLPSIPELIADANPDRESEVGS